MNSNHTNAISINEYKNSGEDITIIFGNRQRISIPYKQAKKFSFFKNTLACKAPKYKQDVIQIPKSAPKFITKKNFLTLLNDDMNNLIYQELIKMYQLADFLSAKEEVFYPLAERYVSKYLYTQKYYPEILHKNCNSEYVQYYHEIKKFLGIKYLITKAKKAHAKIVSLTTSRVACWFAELSSLHDIDYMSMLPELNTKDAREKIKTLNITRNNIDEFNIKKILRVFPNLSLLNLQHNNIAHIQLDNLSELPDNFTLDLRNNPIISIEKSAIQKHPKKCIIYLTKTKNKKINDQIQKVGNLLNERSQYTKHDKFILIAELASIAMLFSLYYPSTPFIENTIVRHCIGLLCLIPYIVDTHFFYKYRKATSNDNEIIWEENDSQLF